VHSFLLQLLDVLWQTCIIHFIIGKVQLTFHGVNIKMLDILDVFKVNITGVPCPALQPSAQERHGPVGAGPEEATK